MSSIQRVKCYHMGTWQLKAIQTQDMSGYGLVGLPSLKPTLQARNWGLLRVHVSQ